MSPKTAFLLTVLFSPYEWPVTAQNFNFSCGAFPLAFPPRRPAAPPFPDADLLSGRKVIFGTVTIMGIVSWYIVPEDAWLSKRMIGRVLDATEGKDTTEGEGKEVEGSGSSIN